MNARRGTWTPKNSSCACFLDVCLTQTAVNHTHTHTPESCKRKKKPAGQKGVFVMYFCICDRIAQRGSRAARPPRDREAESSAGTGDSVRQNTKPRSSHDTWRTLRGHERLFSSLVIYSDQVVLEQWDNGAASPSKWILSFSCDANKIW